MTNEEPLQILPHQVQELEFLRNHPRVLLLSETGTGKTITLLSRVQDVLSSGETVLWVTSKSLQAQLVKEASKWLPESMQPAPFTRAGQDRPFIYLTHRLAQMRVSDLLKHRSHDLLIVDEAADVGGGGANPKHKTFQALKRLSMEAQSSVFATAEPLGSLHALDLWALADCTGIPQLPNREVMNAWVEWRELPTSNSRVAYTPSGISNDGFNILLSKIRPNQIRTQIDDVTKLPPLAISHHPVALTDQAQKDYDQANGLHGLDRHMARQQSSRDSSAIIPEVMDLLQKRYAEHKSVLVFSEMFDLLNPLARELDARGISFLQIDGSVPEGRRGKILDRHQRGEVRVLLLTSAAEAGINAQQSTLLISVVQSYSPSRERQREGRIRRIGSVGPELVHAIVRPEVGHEKRRSQILDEKENLIQLMWKFLE